MQLTKPPPPLFLDLLKNATVLVVDDYQGMRTMLRNVVKEMGIARVDTANSGKDALNLLSQGKYDLVLCDYNLGPGQNGQQVLEEARLNKYIGLACIWIMVSAEKSSEMVLGAVEVKPDDYLFKPINQAMLETRLQRLVTRKKVMAEIGAAVEEENYLKAIALCDERLQEGNTQPQELLRIKSQLLMTIGAFDGAQAVFETVLKERNVPWARVGMGKVQFAARDYASARMTFESVLEENRMYMEAADWLARTLDAMGEGEQAQKVLEDAARRSPNSAARQKSLAETAYRNGALDVAQMAFEKTIKVSEFSSHKNPAAFTGLAKVLSDQENPERALRVLDQSRKEFANNPEAAIQMAAAESVVYKNMGDTAKAEAAMAVAEQVMSQLEGKVSAEVAMDMAKSYFKLEKKDRAAELLGNVIKNNHENVELSRQVEGIFEREQMGEAGQELIEKARQEVFGINNEGVRLANAGKLKEGVELLRKAVHELPTNQVIILNLAGLLIAQMSREGKDNAIAAEVRMLIDQAIRINAANKKIHEYSAVLDRLMKGA